MAQYTGDMTWTDLVNRGGGQANNVIHAIRDGEDAYLKWIDFRDGRDDPTLAAVLGVTETAVSEMHNCFLAQHFLYQFMTNTGTPPAGNYQDFMRPLI